jgi:hypothetical protein
VETIIALIVGAVLWLFVRERIVSKGGKRLLRKEEEKRERATRR